MRFSALLFLHLLNHTAYKGSKVLVTLFAIELGASPFVVGALFAMYSLFPAFLSVHAGKLSDRLGFRLPMLLGASGLLAGLTVPFFFPTVLGLFFAAGLMGLCYIFYLVTVQYVVGTVGTDADRTRNYSYFSIVVGATSLAGPTIAGFAIEGLGYRSTFLLFALFPVIPVLTLAFLSKSGAKPASVDPKRSEHRIVDLLRLPPLRRVLITAGLLETGNELVNFLLPIYGHSVGLSPSQIGLVMGAFAAALLAMRAFMPFLVRHSSEERVLSSSMGVAALACVLFPFVTTFYPLAGVAFVMGLGLGCGAPLSLLLTYNRAPDGRNGEAMGLRQVVNKSTEVMVPLVFGSISTALGMFPVFWLDALLLGTGGWLMHREAHRRLSDARPGDPGAQAPDAAPVEKPPD